MRNGSNHESPAVRRPAREADAPDGKGSALALATDWRTGPRTRAWDDLWRRLLAGLAESDRSGPRTGDMPAVRRGGHGD